MAATDYRKAQLQLLYDLIEQSNPGFQAQYTLDKLIFDTVTAITVDSADPYKKDTSIRVKGKAGSGIIGSQIVKYRRIDLSALFRNQVVTLVGWTSDSTGYVRANWISEWNSRYGLALLDADFDSAWQTMTSGSRYNIPVLAACACYKGTTNIGWVKGKRPMANIATDANRALAGRLYPGGNDFTTPGRKPQGEWQVYGMDASSIKANMDWGTSGSVPAVGNTTAGFTNILNWLNANTGRTNWSNKDASVEGGICGITWYTYTLPSSNVLEANSARFTRVTVLQSAANSWFAGKILIHWNA